MTSIVVSNHVVKKKTKPKSFTLYQTFTYKNFWVWVGYIYPNPIPKTPKFLYSNPKIFIHKTQYPYPKPKKCYAQTQTQNPKIFWVKRLPCINHIFKMNLRNKTFLFNWVFFFKEQLKEIKKMTFSRVLCNSFEIVSIQRNVFFVVSRFNPRIPCSEHPQMNLSFWKETRGQDERANYPQWDKSIWIVNIFMSFIASVLK